MHYRVLSNWDGLFRINTTLLFKKSRYSAICSHTEVADIDFKLTVQQDPMGCHRKLKTVRFDVNDRDLMVCCDKNTEP